MTDRSLARLFLLLTLTLGACAPETAWMPTESPKKLHVERVRMKHDTAFAPGSSELSPAEAERLMTFLSQTTLHAEDRVYLAPAPEDRLAGARIGQMVKELNRRHIGAETLATPSDAVAPNHMLVLVDRYVVTLPNCPDWSASPVSDHSNVPSSNLGCANTTNLGLMVADPRDLVMGREPGPADADPALQAIARYRAGKVKSLSAAGATQSGSGGGQTGGAGQE
jgi:pilus assembly protein CpaD